MAYEDTQVANAGRDIDDYFTGTRKKKEARDKIKELRTLETSQGNAAANETFQNSDEYEQDVGKQVDAYKQKRNQYVERLNSSDDRLQTEQRGYLDEALNQSKNAKTVYGSLTSRSDDLMNQYQNDSNNAMSLQESTDPNNRVARDTRAFYDTQANQVNQQGMQNYGVLSALGAQANQNYGGSAPLTTGQIVAMGAANQRQAGEAYARTQQHMQALRDQGIQQGFDRSDLAYNRGQNARSAYQGAIANRQDLATQEQNAMAAYRAEQSGYGQNANMAYNGIQKRNMGVNSEDFGLDESRLARMRDNKNRRVGDKLAAEMGAIASQRQTLAEQQQTDAANRAMILKGAGTVAGAAATIYGGPLAGAAVYGGINAMGGQADPAVQAGANQYYQNKQMPTQNNYGVYNNLSRPKTGNVG